MYSYDCRERHEVVSWAEARTAVWIDNTNEASVYTCFMTIYRADRSDEVCRSSSQLTPASYSHVTEQLIFIAFAFVSSFVFMKKLSGGTRYTSTWSVLQAGGNTVDCSTSVRFCGEKEISDRRAYDRLDYTTILNNLVVAVSRAKKKVISKEAWYKILLWLLPREEVSSSTPLKGADTNKWRGKLRISLSPE